MRHLVRTAEGKGSVAAVRAGDIVRSGLPTSDGYGSILHPHDDGTALIGSSRAAWLTPEPEDPSVPRQLLRNAIRIAPRHARQLVAAFRPGDPADDPDERPVIGRVLDGLVVATGHGSEGVINGAGTAELVASVVLGERPPFDASLFDPFRFA